MSGLPAPARRQEKKWPALRIPLGMMVLFWGLGIALWRATGRPFYLFNFGYIGSAVGLGMTAFILAPRRQKPWGRRLAQFLVGSYMLVFLGLLQRENMQLEGFFFYLLAGTFAGSVIHYLVAKIVGPLIFQRGWCGWSCWTAMILDLFPFRRRLPGRLPAPWGFLRYLHFALSLGLVLWLWFGRGYRPAEQGLEELHWLLAGNALYYTAGIALAVILRDNRAFCKYLCPIPTLQKLPARASVLKIAGDPDRCDGCGACLRACPMDIRVFEYVRRRQRVLSTECIFCMECIFACPRGALQVSAGLDAGGPEFLRYR
jgi:polyferredoxin